MLPANITCLIIDDEPPARHLLRDELAAFDDLQVVGEADSVDSAAILTCKLKPALLFLDIQLCGSNGFDLLTRLQPDLPAVIFVTAFDLFAVRAFEVNALDYLLKPICPERLAAAVQRARERLAIKSSPAQPFSKVPRASLRSLPTANPQTSAAVSATAPLIGVDAVLIEAGNSGFFVMVEDVLLIEADGNYSRLLMADGRVHTHRQPLVEWERRLPAAEFARLDRATIINTHRIRTVAFEGRCANVSFAASIANRSFGRTASARLRAILNRYPNR